MTHPAAKRYSGGVESFRTPAPTRPEPGLEGLRDLLRSTLGRSLRGIAPEDRLAAAWTVACGRTLAVHAAVAGYAAGTVHIQVADPVWLAQLGSMRGTLARQLAQISGLPVTAMEFTLAPSPVPPAFAKSEAR